MTKSKIWRNFNLGLDNPDPGRALLLALDHPRRRIMSYRAHIARSLIARGVSLNYTPKGPFEYHVSPESESSIERIEELLVKLSNSNEAVGYSERGFDKIEGFSDFVKYIKTRYKESVRKSRKVDADFTLNTIAGLFISNLSKSDKYSPLPKDVKLGMFDLNSFIRLQNS